VAKHKRTCCECGNKFFVSEDKGHVYDVEMRYHCGNCNKKGAFVLMSKLR